MKDANTSIEDLTIGLLHEYGYFGINDSVIVQSFQENSIQYVAERTEFPVSFLSSAPLSDSTLERYFYNVYCSNVNSNHCQSLLDWLLNIFRKMLLIKGGTILLSMIL